MKKICCSALFRALIEHRDGLEWTPVSEGDAAGPIVVGMWTEAPRPRTPDHVSFTCSGKARIVRGWPIGKLRKGFLPLMWCPYCGAEI